MGMMYLWWCDKCSVGRVEDEVIKSVFPRNEEKRGENEVSEYLLGRSSEMKEFHQKGQL